MKKRRNIILGICLVLSLFAAGLVARGFASHEIKSASHLTYQDGFLYGIDTRDDFYYIFRTDMATGKSQYIMSPRQLKGAAIQISNLSVTEDGVLYLYYGESGIETGRWISRCDFEKGKLEQCWKLSDITPNTFWFLYRNGGKLSMITRAGTYNLQEYVLNEETLSWSGQGVYLLPEDCSALVPDDGIMWVMNPAGDIYVSNRNGEASKVFENNETQIGTANYQHVSQNGSLHFTNAGANRNYVLEKKEKRYVLRACASCVDADVIRRELGYVTDLDWSASGTVFGITWKDGNQVPFVYGESAAVVERLSLSGGHVFLIFSVCATLAFLILLAIFGSFYGIYRMYGNMFPLSLQMVFLILPLFCLVSFLSSRAIGTAMEGNLLEREKKNLLNLCSQFAASLDKEKMEALSGEPFSEYDKYLTPLTSTIQNLSYYDMGSGAEVENTGTYAPAVYAYQDGEIYCLTAGTGVDVPIRYSKGKDLLDAIGETVSRQMPTALSHQDINGKWLSVFLPYEGGDGELQLVLQMRTNLLTSLRNIAVQRSQLNGRMMRLIGLLLGGMAILVFFTLLPLRELSRRVEEMTRGKLGIQVRTGGITEVGKISRVFNRMSASISVHMDQLSAISRQYAKFVPLRFFHLIGKDDVLEIRLGDYVEEEFVVADISCCGFSEISAAVSGQEMFGLMNQSLGVMIPIIEENGGTVEQFTDAGTISVFERGGEEPLRAAVSLMERLNGGVLVSGEQTLSFTAGLCLGPVRLGIIGADTRMEAATVSMYRQLSSFLQDMAEKYGARILMTATAAEQIPDFETSYHKRTLGYLYIRAEKRLEKIYDVYDGDPAERRLFKEQTRDSFENGLSLFLSGKYREARAAFIRVMETNRDDLAARHYFYLCETCLYGTDETKRVQYIESF